MPSRDWLHNLAVRRCVILAALLFASASHAQDKRDTPGPRPEAQSEQRGGPAPPAPAQRDVNAKGYRSNCDKPKDREEADLCEQRRMADAAKEALIWAENIFWFNVLQLGGLVVAAIFAAIAAFAARRTVNVMEGTAQRQLRAYVMLDWLRLEGILGQETRVLLRVRNYGQTPAKNTRHFGRVLVCPYVPGRKFVVDRRMGGPVSTMTVSPGNHFDQEIPVTPISDVAVAAINKGEAALYCYGIIEYEDAFAKKRTTTYRHIIGGNLAIAGHRFTICEEGNEYD